ncbi:MAG: phosphopantetheine-binding protein, partial [Pseudomonadota bacterium]
MKLRISGGVRNVLAFGLPDPVHGETLGVAVEMAAGREASKRARILAAARQGLASYMVPEHVVILPELPLNSVGKLSRKGVVQRVLADPALLAVETEAVEGPPSELVTSILALLRATLKRPDLPPAANFFDEGGDSLAAIELLMDIEEQFGLPI